MGESEARGAQQDEEFAGPEQNVEQASALEIAQVFRVEARVEGFSRALLDEGAHGGRVDGFGGKPAAARVDVFQFFVTARQEVVQAESLAIQRCNRGAATRTHPAVSLPPHRIHWTQALCFNSTAQLILLRFSRYVRCARQRKRFQLWKYERLWKYAPAP